jgi:hypothetical protein
MPETVAQAHNTGPQAYYRTFGMMTDPGEHAAMLEDLPQDVAGLCRAVQGCMVHVFWAERYGLSLSPERKQEVQVRPVVEKLALMAAMDARPLAQPRPLERRLVGNCRDFTLMLCTLMRCQGYSARSRCGFGTYFLPDHYEDHWVCEYWHPEQGRWVMVDPQLDEYQREVLRVDFDPVAVPPQRFLTAGRAWQLCRAGRADPDSFGIFDMKGLWFIRGNVLRDLAALNQVEMLPWDVWGLIGGDDQSLTDDDWAALDTVAALSVAGDEAFGRLRACYEGDARLRVPLEVQSQRPAA